MNQVAHVERAVGRDKRADRKHELELLALDASRSPQSHDQRHRPGQEPGEHEQPAGNVDRPIAAREPNPSGFDTAANGSS